MSAATSTALSREAKLVRLLGSPNEHERLASLNMLGRTLRAAGSDFNDLASRLDRTPVQARRSAPPMRWDPDSRFTIAWTLQEALTAGIFSEWESAFTGSVLGTMRAKDGRLSQRQIEVVDGLLAKVWRSQS